MYVLKAVNYSVYIYIYVYILYTYYIILFTISDGKSRNFSPSQFRRKTVRDISFICIYIYICMYTCIYDLCENMHAIYSKKSRAIFLMHSCIHVVLMSYVFEKHAYIACIKMKQYTYIYIYIYSYLSINIYINIYKCVH